MRPQQTQQPTCCRSPFETSVKSGPGPPPAKPQPDLKDVCLAPHVPLHNLKWSPVWDSRVSCQEGFSSRGLAFPTTLQVNNRSSFQLPCVSMSHPPRAHLLTKRLNRRRTLSHPPLPFVLFSQLTGLQLLDALSFCMGLTHPLLHGI